MIVTVFGLFDVINTKVFEQVGAKAVEGSVLHRNEMQSHLELSGRIA
jgi:hypothetical protein